MEQEMWLARDKDNTLHLYIMDIVGKPYKKTTLCGLQKPSIKLLFQVIYSPRCNGWTKNRQRLNS